MAKGSFLGVKRGKIGDIVGYQVTNSNDKDKQGWRPYQPRVRNPQSDGQMVQRCKMAAVNNLYRALKEVIKRGFENHKYGDDSRRAWLKMALGQDFSTGPWMVKGSMQPVPIVTVPITVGSLPPVNVSFDDTGEYITNIPCETAPSDVAALSSLFIGAGYQEGDQVTIINGWVPLRLSFAWRVVSFYISTSDSTPLSDLDIIATRVSAAAGDLLSLRLNQQTDALAIAVSRDGNGINLRSTTYAATDPVTVDAVYYGDMMYEAAKRSYITESTRDANWPIQPGTRGAGSAYVATRGDGTTFVPVEVSIQGSGYTTVEDPDGNLLYVKNVDTHNAEYNRWLKAKSSGIESDVWSTTAPAELETDQWCKFIPGSGASAYDVSFFNYLVANGYNARCLMGYF